MIAIIDYGAGNLHSVQKAIEVVGGQAVVTDRADIILGAEKAVLPGVGAFKDGMSGLAARALIAPIREFINSGKPFLGICLGMQLLFDESQEQGEHPGLGVLPGQVLAFDDPAIRIPQIGWNQLELNHSSPLFEHIKNGSYVYFNHSYYCAPDNAQQIAAATTYGHRFASAVHWQNIYGVQFHPEKSQAVGLQILKNFVAIKS